MFVPVITYKYAHNYMKVFQAKICSAYMFAVCIVVLIILRDQLWEKLWIDYSIETLPVVPRVCILLYEFVLYNIM